MPLPVPTEYSLAADGDKQITPHFKVREFRCHDGSDKILMATETVELLEKVRAFYGEAKGVECTIVVNSGYRTPAYNRRIGGATRSQHIAGRAVDFTVRIPGGGIVSPLTVYNDIHTMRIFGHHNGGLGRYGRFTHIDTGADRRWHG